VTEVRCDRCGAKVLQLDRTRLAIQRPGQRDYGPDQDYCEPCLAGLLEWMTAVSVPPVEAPAEGDRARVATTEA